jgi:hypothetical protein
MFSVAKITASKRALSVAKTARRHCSPCVLRCSDFRLAEPLSGSHWCASPIVLKFLDIECYHHQNNYYSLLSTLALNKHPLRHLRAFPAALTQCIVCCSSFLDSVCGLFMMGAGPAEFFLSFVENTGGTVRLQYFDTFPTF